MEIIQAVLFGLLIGGMITFLGLFLRQRYSSVRSRLQAKPQLNTDLMRPQMASDPVFLSAKLSETAWRLKRQDRLPFGAALNRYSVGAWPEAGSAPMSS